MRTFLQLQEVYDLKKRFKYSTLFDVKSEQEKIIYENRTPCPMIIIFNLISVCSQPCCEGYLDSCPHDYTVSIQQRSDILYHIALIIGVVILLVQRRKIACCVRG